MKYLTALLYAIVRLLRPCEGLHADPSGYIRTVVAELRNRSRRVRRYAEDLPPAAQLPAPPRVPAPRRPADDVLPATLPTFRVPDDYVPVVDPANVAAPAAIVRPYLLAHEHQRAERKAAQQQAGIDALRDAARNTSEVRA